MLDVGDQSQCWHCVQAAEWERGSVTTHRMLGCTALEVRRGLTSWLFY